eukprot:CAMPEP_0184291484 /NCGR_PEP_ID=MMETSP1049-20130417/3506_1 /TAXON_ID=77928 /ORGANISM="Proteomonas sulcata, Strain CCMP704" /LENGTH=163 /DNA_ID=CAMNT_0026598953 /DNA_START=440 /DNA_END=931 /DNA_ORIENTATION=-
MGSKTSPEPKGLFNAAFTGDLEALKAADPEKLASRCTETGNTLLIWAAEGGQVSAIEFLLAQNPKLDVNAGGLQGNTALLRACRNGHSSAVQRLIAEKANPDLPNTKGQYPLHMAAFYKHLSCVKALVDSGADLKVEDKKGRTPDQDTKDEEIAQFLRASLQT